MASISTNTPAPEGVEIHWIQPAGPTRLEGCLYMPIRGLDHYFNSMPGIWVIHGSIDPAKLRDAIASTLALYPHAAGRLRQGKQGHWRIMLSNSPVPLTVTSSKSVASETELRQGHPEFSDPWPWMMAPPANAEEFPLIKFKLVKMEATGDTAIIMTACHVIADGTTFTRIMRTVSDFYQGLAPEYATPTYEKYFDEPPVAQSEDYGLATKYLPPHAIPRDLQSVMQIFMQMMGTTECVDIHFTDEQLRLLQSKASKSSGQQLSRGDALIAYLFTVFNKVFPVKFNELMSVIGFRGRKGPSDADYLIPTDTTVGNVVFDIFVGDIPDDKLTDLAGLASVVRETIVKCQDYDFLKACIAVTEHKYCQASEQGGLAGHLPGDRTLRANLMHKLDGPACHFGYPGTARFYTYSYMENSFVVYQANPTVNEDGTFTSHDGDVDVFFRVKREYKDTILAGIKKDMADLAVD